jgi:hypothetical protein
MPWNDYGFLPEETLARRIYDKTLGKIDNPGTRARHGLDLPPNTLRSPGGSRIMWIDGEEIYILG